MKKRAVVNKFFLRSIFLIGVLLSGMTVMLTGCSSAAVSYCKICGEKNLSEEKLQNEHGLGKCADKAECNKLFHYVFPDEEENKHVQCELCSQWKCEIKDHGEGVCTSIAVGSPALLKNLTVMEGNTIHTLTPAFSSDQFAYSIDTVLKKGSKVQVTGEAENENASVTGGGIITLKEGSNEIRIAVKEGDAERFYRIKIWTGEKEEEKEEDLTVKEEKKEKSKQTEEKQMIEKKNDEKIPEEVQPVLEDPIETPQPVNEEPEDLQPEVPPEQPPVLISSDASLKSLYVILNGEEQQEIRLEPGSTEYVIETELSEIFEIEVIGSTLHENAVITGNGIHTMETAGEILTISVMAEDGITIQTYTIRVGDLNK